MRYGVGDGKKYYKTDLNESIYLYFILRETMLYGSKNLTTRHSNLDVFHILTIVVKCGYVKRTHIIKINNINKCLACMPFDYRHIALTVGQALSFSVATSCTFIFRV